VRPLGPANHIISNAQNKNSQEESKQDGQRKYKRNNEERSRNHCRRGKAISITYPECVSVALVIQQVKRMRHIILSFVACLVLSHISTFSHTRHDFREKSNRT